MRNTILIAFLLFSGVDYLRAQYLTPVYLRQTVDGQVEFDPNPLVHFLFQNKIPTKIDSSSSVRLIKYLAQPKRDTIFNYGVFVSNYLDSYSFSAEGFCWNYGIIIPHFPSALNTATFKKLKKNQFELQHYLFNSDDFSEYKPHFLKLKYNHFGRLAEAQEFRTWPHELEKKKKNKKINYKTTLTNWNYHYKENLLTRINTDDYNVVYTYDQAGHLVSIISARGALDDMTSWLNADSLESLARRKSSYYEIGSLLDKGNTHIYYASFYKYSKGKPIEMLTYEASTGLAVVKKTLVYDSLQRISVFDDGLAATVFYDYENQTNRLRSRKVIHYSDWTRKQDPVDLSEERYFYNEDGLIERIENRNNNYFYGELKLTTSNGESGVLFKYKCKSCPRH